MNAAEKQTVREALEKVAADYDGRFYSAPWRDDVAKALAILDREEAQPVGEWVTVPREPTEAMILAAKRGIRIAIEEKQKLGEPMPWVKKPYGYKVPEVEKIIARYKAMLAAAPKPQPEGVGDARGLADAHIRPLKPTGEA